jgi:hypothetical protein
MAVGDSATILTSTDTLNWTVQPAPSGITGFLHGIALIPASNPTGTSSTNAFLVTGALAGNGTGSVNTGVYLTAAPNGTGLTFSGYGQVTGSGNLEAVLVGPASGTSPNATVAVAAGWSGSLRYFNNPSYPWYYGGFAASPTIVPNVVYRGLAYGGGSYVVAGEQGTILTSPDGINWTQRFSGQSPSTLSTAVLLNAAYSPVFQRFVVVGTGGTILVSTATPPVFGNVSTRGYVSSTQTFIGGFVVQGTGSRNVLIRGDGPILASFGVASPLPDPVLTVYNASGTIIATNTGWGSNTSPSTVAAAATAVGAFPLTSGGLDSAVLLNLQPGAYTVQITSARGNSGIALFEAYTY